MTHFTSPISMLLVGLACLAAPVASAQTAEPAWGVYTDASVEAWSNGTPVLGLDGQWAKGYERRSGTQRAYAAGRVEVGVQLPWPWQAGGHSWRLGAVTRADANARLSDDAAQALYHYQSRTDPDTPVTLDAGSEILFWRGSGLAVHAPAQHWGAFTMDVRFEHLRLQRLRSLQSAGQVTYNANDTYSYVGTLRDDHSQARSIFILPPEKNGVGQALSVGLSWRKSTEAPTWLTGAWTPDHVSLRVDDAWSSLRWKGMLGDDAVLNSNVADLGDAQINGQYTRRTVRERIPVSTQVRLEWAHPEGLWSVRVKNRLGLWQGWLGWQAPGAIGWRVAVEPFAGAVQLGVDWRGLSASVMSDRLDNGAHVRGGQLSWMTAF